LHSSLLCVKQPNLLLHYPLLHFLPFCLRQFPVVRGFESTRLWGGAEGDGGKVW